MAFSIHRLDRRAIAGVVTMLLVACGGGGGESPDTAREDTSSDGAAGTGAVADPQPPGQGKAIVDDLELTFTEPGATPCRVEEDEFGFSFIIGDNEIVFGGGGVRGRDGGWSTAPRLVIANPEGEPGPISYQFVVGSEEVVTAGNSASVTGPMEKQPANDGSNPLPVAVGDGVFTFTCP